MKLTLSIVMAALTLIACQEKPTNNQPKDGNIDDSIIQLLMSHYEIDEKDSNWLITRDSVSVMAEYHDPELMIDGELLLSEMMAYSFPLRANEYLFGDLNDDGQDEVVLNEVVLGATHGPMMLDIFVFEGNPGAYKKRTCVTAHELSQCNEGAFTPAKIEKGFLIGTASCFDDDDPMCCPSLAYDLSFKLDGEKFVLNEKKERPKNHN